MKTIDDYMKLPYRLEIVEDTAEGGYVASFPDLKGCITCADAADEALRLAMDAKKEWLKAAIEDGYDIPLPDIDDLDEEENFEENEDGEDEIFDEDEEVLPDIEI